MYYDLNDDKYDLTCHRILSEMSLYLDPTMYEVRGKNYDMASFLFIVIELSDQLTYSAT